MQNEEYLLIRKAELLQIEISMHGMIAENKQREAVGESMAYTEKDFNVLWHDTQNIIDNLRS